MVTEAAAAVILDVERYLLACGVAFLQSLPALSLYTGTAGLPQGRLRAVLAEHFDAHSNSGVVPPDLAWSQCVQTFLTGGTQTETVAFSADGQQLLTVTFDNVVDHRCLCLWTVATGEARQLPLLGPKPVALFPDGHQLALGGGNAVRLWGVETGDFTHDLVGHEDEVLSVAFSPDGRHLASGSRDKTVRLWDVGTGACLQTLGHSNGVHSVVFSADDRHLASMSSDGILSLWLLTTGEATPPSCFSRARGLMHYMCSSPPPPLAKCLRVLRVLGVDHMLSQLALSRGGRALSVASRKGAVVLWDVATVMTRGCHVRTTARCHTLISEGSAEVWSVAFSPDDRHLVSGSADCTVRIWDVATHECTQVLRGHSGCVYSVAFSPDGRHLASGSHDGTAKLWDVAGNGDVAPVQETGNGAVCVAPVQETRNYAMSYVAVSPDGRLVASGCLYEKTMTLWELETGERVKVLAGHTGAVLSVAFSPDGRHLASGSLDKTVRLWEVGTGGVFAVLEGHTSWVLSVAFSPDGRHLASGSKDMTVRLWDVGTGGVFAVLEGHTSWVLSVVFSADGRHLASVETKGTEIVRVWELATRGVKAELKPGHTPLVAFTDGCHLVMSAGNGDRAVKVWNVETGEYTEEFDRDALKSVLGSLYASGEVSLFSKAPVADGLERSQPASADIASAGLDLEATDHSVVVRVGAVTVTMPLPTVVSKKWRGFKMRSSDGKVVFWRFDKATPHVFRVCVLGC